MTNETTKDPNDNVVSIRDKFKLITNKALNVVRQSDPVVHIDERTLMRCFMQSPLYASLSQLYPENQWISWERTSSGYNITLFKKEDKE